MDRRLIQGAHRISPPEGVLRLVGRPDRRDGSTFAYCVAGVEAQVAFDAHGRAVATGMPAEPTGAATATTPGPTLLATGCDPGVPLIVAAALVVLAILLRRRHA